MAIPRFVVKVAQHACGLEPGEIDGLVGPRTIAAAREYDTECDDFDVPLEHSDKLVTTVAQHAAGLRGDDLDGVVGSKSKAAMTTYLTEHGIETASPKPAAKRAGWSGWQPCENPGVYVKDGIDLRDGTVIIPPDGLDPIPSRNDRDEVFGNAKVLGEKGMQRHLVTIDNLPGRFNKGKGRLPQVHEKVAPHIRLAFELWQTFGVLDEVYKIWFFNYRHQRHDSSRPLSLHAWGIACDINPRENFAWYPKGPEKSIQPFSEGWAAKYPRGLSDIAVLCMKKAGFGWGGDWPSFRDPMHFQLLA